jgi:cytochrome c553
MKNLFLSLTSVLLASATVFSAHAQDAQGDIQAGAQKNAMCIGCHGIPGYQASFPEVYRVPMISGQNAKFIASALNAYKKGERKHPTMRAIADSLTDKDIVDLSAYYADHGSTLPASTKTAATPSDKVSSLLNKGGCIACHGEGFNKPVDPSYPKVAGQPANYLYVALKSYKTEGTEKWGRSNGIMGGVAKQFSNAELKELASYVADLPGDVKTVPQHRFR